MPHGKLGKLSPKYDDRTLQYAEYSKRPTNVPPSLAWTYGEKTWPAWRNLDLGCCTISAQAGLVDVWSTRARTPVIVSDSAVVSAYSDVSGYRPDDPSTDRGATMLDALNHFRKVGLGGRKIAAFAALEPNNLTLLNEAIFLFGGVYIGLALPRSAQRQTGQHRTWSVVAGPSGQPGGWGGHCVGLFGWNRDVYTVLTWGAVQYATIHFIQKYMDEAYACVSEDFLNQKGMSPSGVDLAALMADLKGITG